jgi:hypothetical protein
MAMNIRGMSGKLNAMWNSSPVPKYGSRSSGHWLASARSRVPGYFSSTNRRSFLRNRCVHPEPVDPVVQPERDDSEDLVVDGRVVVVQVRLVGEEPVEVVLPGDRVPGPVGLLRVLEDDADALVLLIRVAPDVVVPVRGVRVPPGLLEPRVLVGRVVQHQVGDDPDAALVGGRGEGLEVLDRAEGRVDAVEVGDVVPVVLERGRVDGHEPQAVHAQVAQVVELFGQPAEVAEPVRVGVEERPDGHLVEDGVLVPVGRVVGHP